MQDQQEEFLAFGGSVEAFPDSSALPKNELAAEVVRCFGELRLRVNGSSMLPGVRPEDVLLIRHCRIEEAGRGDIVLYIRQRRLFAHRVISWSGARLVTQGDGVAEPDLPVTANELLGKVVRVMRRGKTICHESKPTLPARMGAALFRRFASAWSFRVIRFHVLGSWWSYSSDIAEIFKVGSL